MQLLGQLSELAEVGLLERRDFLQVATLADVLIHRNSASVVRSIGRFRRWGLFQRELGIVVFGHHRRLTFLSRLREVGIQLQNLLDIEELHSLWMLGVRENVVSIRLVALLGLLVITDQNLFQIPHTTVNTCHVEILGLSEGTCCARCF